MRTTATLSITLPPAMLKEAARRAKRENRTMSELVREALRQYERQQRWNEINAYGRAKANELGITEADVVPLIKEFRKEQRRRTLKSHNK
jgi:metal-responsive CopG/Arc/MetJ family transcriptional regulator